MSILIEITPDLLTVLKQIRADAITIVENKDTDDIDAWINFVNEMTTIIDSNVFVVLPNRPQQYKPV